MTFEELVAAAVLANTDDHTTGSWKAKPEKRAAVVMAPAWKEILRLRRALADALAEVEHYAPRGKELGGPFADATRKKARTALGKSK